jgi:hypothetical protein
MIRATLSIAILLLGLLGRAESQTADAISTRSTDEHAAEKEQGASRAGALTSKPTNSAKPLRFRRVYVPETELLDRVKRRERYVPMNAADFEERLSRLRSEDRAVNKPKAGILYANYSAALDSMHHLNGTATWHIKLEGKEPSLLPLPGLGLALREPRWAPSGSSSSAPAMLGATEADEAALYADRSGTVMFDWSLAGSPDREGRRIYDLALPPGPAHRLELTLPTELTPAMEGAIISAPRPLGTEKRRWTIDVVGQPTGKLRLSGAGEKGRSKPPGLIRPKLTYELSRQGLQLSAEWQIDVHGEPIKSISVDLDAELTLLSADSGGTALEWSQTADTAAGAKKPLILRFPEPLQGLIAAAPLKNEPAWKLPSVAARELIWQDGSMALVVAAPISVARLELSQCRQTKRESLPAPAVGEAIGIQAFSSAASVVVHLAPLEDRLELRSGTTIELLGDEARGSYVAEISARQGELAAVHL